MDWTDDDPWGEKTCPHTVRDASRTGIIYCVDCGAVVYRPHQDLRPDRWSDAQLTRLYHDVMALEGED